MTFRRNFSKVTLNLNLIKSLILIPIDKHQFFKNRNNGFSIFNDSIRRQIYSVYSIESQLIRSNLEFNFSNLIG